MLDSYAADLRDRSRSACRAALVDATLPAELYARATSCLDARLAALGGVVDGIDADKPSSVRGALIVAAGLPLIAPCEDAGWLQSPDAFLPEDADERAAVVDLTRELAALHSFHAAADDDAAGVEQMTQLLVAVEAVDWPPLAAEILLRRSGLAARAGDAPAALQDAERAFAVATSVHRDDLAAAAAAMAARLLSTGLGRVVESRVWIQVARSLASNAAYMSDSWRATLQSNLGVLSPSRGNPPWGPLPAVAAFAAPVVARSGVSC